MEAWTSVRGFQAGKRFHYLDELGRRSSRFLDEIIDEEAGPLAIDKRLPQAEYTTLFCIR